MHDVNDVVLAEHGCERVLVAHVAVNEDDRPVVTPPSHSSATASSGD